MVLLTSISKIFAACTKLYPLHREFTHFKLSNFGNSTWRSICSNASQSRRIPIARIGFLTNSTFSNFQSNGYRIINVCEIMHYLGFIFDAVLYTV